MTKETKLIERPTSPDVSELLAMLTYKRPSGGATEAAFIRRFLLPLGVQRDEYGNHWLQIGKAPILWSCHTDTVHGTEGKQRILYGDGIASVDNGECLGADCGTGVWLMSEMIRAGVAGTYVFHADEEIGGYGSDYIALETSERLKGIDFAIAFDRKGTNEIITHQMGKRCASDLFATSLAECLRPLAYKASDGGTFTDTANYASFIPECTNISVGYYKQHTKGEHQDVAHALRLRDALCSADWSKLVVARDWQDGTDYLLEETTEGFGPYVRRNAEDVADFLEALGYDQDDVDTFIWGGRA